jgi:hypothetical protein
VRLFLAGERASAAVVRASAKSGSETNAADPTPAFFTKSLLSEALQEQKRPRAGTPERSVTGERLSAAPGCLILGLKIVK